MKMRDRMSFMRTREIRDARLKQASTEEQLRHNAWEMTGLADPAKPVVLPDLLAERGWSDLDYIKLDVDGADFDILQSFAGRFDPLQTIAVQLEVNFVGTDRPDEHTFHNTDRFMRAHGFDLFRLDVRNFSVRALPARYIWPTPAETVSGRPFQGEAYYARDVLAPHRAAAVGAQHEKLAKLAAVFSAWQVPDAAAELCSRAAPSSPRCSTSMPASTCWPPRRRPSAAGRCPIATTWRPSRPMRPASTGPRARCRPGSA